MFIAALRRLHAHPDYELHLRIVSYSLNDRVYFVQLNDVSRVYRNSVPRTVKDDIHLECMTMVPVDINVFMAGEVAPASPLKSSEAYYIN